MLRGLRYRLLLAASIVVLVALIAGGLAAVVDTGFADLSEAIWWAFLRLTDPGYLGDDEGLARRSVSTVVTVLGYVLFLGLLIAILTQWMNETIRNLESGVTPVALSGHIVILGWTHRTPAIVEELLRTGPRAKRFLERHGVRELRVVVLAELVDDALIRLTRERLGDLWNDRQVLLRTGSPQRLDHLERVAFRDAAALILPGADFADRHPGAVDAQTIKTLMSVSKNASDGGSVPPLVVAALYDGAKLAVARRAYAGECEPMAADDGIGRLVAQCLQQPGLWSVFSELLTLQEGNSIYVRAFDGAVGTRFGDLCGALPRAIPIGFIRSIDRPPDLDPDPETVLQEGDVLVFVAKTYDDCALPQLEPAPVLPSKASRVHPAPGGRRRVLVLGWSRKLPSLLWELEHYRDGFEVDVVSATPLEEREEALARHSRGTTGGRVRHVVKPFTVPGVLESLDPAQYDHVVMLASELIADAEQADATTALAYHMLCGLQPEEGRRPTLLIELLAEENRFLFAEEDVIVSPMVASYLLSQVALRRELALVFRELIRAWGAQIVLLPASSYLRAAEAARFADLERAAAERGDIALGFRTRDSGLALNPDREEKFALAPEDEVVVLTTYAEPDAEA